MKNLFRLLFILTISFFLSGCEKSWQSLFNGENLEGWDTYIGPPETGGEAIGLNTDTMNVFSVVEFDGEKVIRISGAINSSLATKAEFENYHLTAEMKWGDEVYTKRNSGLLYHSYGDFGVGLGVWMSSHEFQLWTGNMGDSYRMGKSYAEIPMTKNSEGKYIYTKGAETIPSVPDTESRVVAKDGDYENKIGEWNTIELYCFGRTSVHVVNGKVNMIIYNSGKYLGEENIEPLTKGKIQFQSEGSELFLRNIKIQSIQEIPVEILQ